MKVESEAKLLEYQIKYARDREAFSAMVAGYASGKSDAVFFRAFELNNYRRKQRIRIPVIGITAPTYQILDDTNIIDFENYLNMYNIKYTYRKQKRKIILKGNNSGEFWFRSTEQPEKIVGFDATDMIHDEFDLATIAKQRTTLIKSSARLRQDECKDPTQSFVSTPEGFKMLHTMFEEDKLGTLIKARTYWNTFLTIRYLWNMIFRIYGANVPKEIPEDLMLVYERYQNSKANNEQKEQTFLKKLEMFKIYDKYYKIHYSPLLAQYCGGEFVNMNGLNAYYSFDRKRHIKEYQNVLNGVNTLHIGIDFNVDPMCAIIGIMGSKPNGDKKIIVFDEVEMMNANTYKMTELLNHKYRDYQLYYYPDMTGKARKTSAVQTDIDIIKRSGGIIRGESNMFVRDSLNIINKSFQDDNLEIIPKCKVLIKDLEQVTRDQYGGIDKKDKSITHMSDAFRYLVDRNFARVATTRKGR